MTINKKYQIGLQQVLEHLPIQNKEIKKIKTNLINDFFNETPYFNNMTDVLVKVKFIKKKGQIAYRDILKYDINDLKTSFYLGRTAGNEFRDTFYKQLSKKKIKINTIIYVFIEISYEVTL